MTEDYERGYREGSEQLRQQMEYLNDQMTRVSQILTKAVFLQPAKAAPKPGLRIWLILDADTITTGYYLNGKYLSDGGAYVEPTHWCMIPNAITGGTGTRRRIVKPD